jgi:quercetin dioxygenase-like cupin family protein
MPVVMSGEIDMDLDGTVVHLMAGDVLVQRGTIHNWINKGSEACVIAFVLISAKSVTAGGKTLPAQGYHAWPTGPALRSAGKFPFY